MEKAKVYFSKSITPETVIRLYEALEVELPGKVAVKVHSGEVGNQNFIRPNFWKPMIDQVQGTIVECNTAYEGKRNGRPLGDPEAPRLDGHCPGGHYGRGRGNRPAGRGRDLP